jgi:hypothetical protein
MKAILSILACLFFNLLQGYPYSLSEISPTYKDDELTCVWNSLSDLHHPSAEDYLKIQSYLKHGRRPYLDTLFDNFIAKGFYKEIDRTTCCSNRVLQDMAFTGPSGEEPIFERRIYGGVSADDKSRCIILYASYNSNKNLWTPHCYTQGVLNILEELEQIGYKGHVLYRLGGFPLTERGGLRLIHAPYSFKVLSFIEASLQGYENVLWFDAAMHPTNDLQEVFSIIENEGSLLLYNGRNFDYDYHFSVPILPLAAVESAGLTESDLYEIPHTIATIIGICFSHPKSHELIDEWLRLTSLTIPAMTLYPEEFLLSVASWRTRNKPNKNVLEYFFDIRSRIPIKPIYSERAFWFDKA